MRILAVGLVVAMLTGCSVGATKLSAAVNRYCTLPEASRNLNRAAVDQAVQPHMIRITCNDE